MNPQNIITTDKFPSLAYRRFGSGPALMLLHGFPFTGKCWEGIVDALAKNNTLLIPDLPGAGNSVLADPEVTIEDLASIVPTILDDAGFETCVLAGHSMGGYVSLAAAELFGERIKGLALIHSTALADTEDKKEKRRKIIELIKKAGKQKIIPEMISGLFGESFRNEFPEKIKEQIDEAMRLSESSFIAFYKAMINRPDRQDVLKNASFPILFVLGKEDTVLPFETCMQQIALPGVSFFELYSPCGHMSMFEFKETLENDLRNFVNYCQFRLLYTQPK